jgi:uncharacterized membrane protein
MKIFKKPSVKGSILVSVAFAVLFLILCVGFYRTYVKDTRFSSGINGKVVGECVQNTRIEQTLIIPPTATKLSVLLATYQNKLEGQLTVQLVQYPDNTLVQEWIILNETIADNEYYPLVLKDGFHLGNTDNRYSLIIQSDSSCKSGSSPTAWQSSTDTYFGGDLYVNGELVWGDLCFHIYYRSPEISRLYTLIIVILFLLLIASFFLFQKFGSSIETIFVVFVLILGIAYMIVLPAESAPDEVRHIISAYNVSNALLGGPEAEEALVYFRAEDLNGLYGSYPNNQAYISMYTNFFHPSQNTEYVLSRRDFIIQTPFWTYLPQALGICLGRIFNCNGIITIQLGRLFSLLFFMGVTYYSIKIIPFGKMILFAVSLLPMTLELAASYSYDGMVIALAFLFIALMCRLIFTKESLSIKDIVFPTIVFSLLAPHKYVYIWLAMLSLLLPREKYKATREKWISVGILLGTMTIVLLALKGGQPLYTPGYATIQYRTLSYCLHNVKEIIDIFCNTVMQRSSYYLSTMVGMLLGWLDMYMPQEVLVLSILNLFMATIQTDSDNTVTVKTRHHLVFFMCVLGVFLLTLTAMLLTWTPSWSMVIEGVQGRYFLPVLPLLLFCVQKMDIRSAKSMVKPVAYVGFCTNAICLLHCFSIIANR